ncbi:MAG: Hsp20/alpha crystallin family protein [Candidatus Omnitrophota bacterium]|jgi:HSP20 family protein
MRKILVSIALLVAMAGSACAVTTPTEQDYKNLDELRAKLVRMRREMDKFIKDIVSTYPDQAVNAVDVFGADVKVDVAQTDKDVIVKADLPGMDKDKIEVTLINNKVLKIGGTRDVVKKETSSGMVRQERMTGRFERVLELPVECMNEGINAAYKNGVLEIDIPKIKPGKEEAVKIKVQ